MISALGCAPYVLTSKTLRALPVDANNNSNDNVTILKFLPIVLFFLSPCFNLMGKNLSKIVSQ